ncbi:MAG: biofilm PGA synthesis protein PgaB, partial [Bacteroidales bacterium]
MKNICILLLLNIVLCTQCTSHVEKPIKNALLPKITVGVFDGYGGAKSCILETIAAIKLDSGMNVRSITTSDIANNVLDSINAIIIPGGSGKSQYLNLGLENIKRIKDFIAA